MNPEAVAEWFANERGITRETLRAFGVQLDTARGRVLFPYPNGMKERPDPTRLLREGERRFYFTQGVKPALFQPPVQPGSDVAFLCEGETDTMRLWQETGGKTDVYGIGGINTWRDDLAAGLAHYKQVFVLLDNDVDYMVKHQVDDAWRRVRQSLGGAKRVMLPHDTKDVCEFFDRYDTDTLKLLASKLGQSRYKPVDFNVEPPPVHWLLDGWIAMGDVTVLSGKGGLGKSLVAQALSLAAIRGDQTFLGRDVHTHGRALLVDQENPEDVVYSRMLRFGLDPTLHSGSLRYLWNQGIRLDRDPDTLLDEIQDFKPVVVTLDSLTRLHTMDEGSNSEMAKLFNAGITPLARESGAAVILIHHHDKNGNGARGAGDIVNAADASIDVYERIGAEGQFTLRINKSRRKPKGAELHVAIRDTAGGGLVLEPIAVAGAAIF